MALDYSNLTRFNELSFYSQHFTDAALWEPYVREACRRHGFSCKSIRRGLPGTNPTFIIDEHWVVKFYGRLFEGLEGFEIEKQVNQFVTAQGVFPSPALVAAGRLCEGNADWPWPYLIFEYVPGVSIGEVYEQVSREEKLSLASELGVTVRRLHDLPLPGEGLLRPTWDGFTAFLARQRENCIAQQTEWGVLSPTLIAQIDAYLPPVESLLDRTAPPCLIHADLTRDHILGNLKDGHWKTHAIIDFGDAKIANLDYELIALYIDLLDLDKRLLQQFLNAYGAPDLLKGKAYRKAMAYTLLFPFEIFSFIFRKAPEAANAASLEELAVFLWKLD